MSDRRRLTTLDKLKIVVRQARCPECGEKLGDLSGLEWHHEHELALGGADEIGNIVALHAGCHSKVTRGSGATTAGSSIGRIAKTRRLTKQQEEFRRRMLEKPLAGLPADYEDRGARRGRIPSRPFPKRTRRT